MTSNRIFAIAAVSLPALILAGLGLTHPHHLDGSTASWWMYLHIILVPLFPLLGVAIWVLLRGRRGILAWTARVAAFAYMVMYGALDAIAGVGVGAVMLRAESESSEDVPGLPALFSVGNKLGTYGAYAFLLAAILTIAALAVARPRPRWSLFIPGSVVILAAGYSFRSSHIYWPVGVTTMLAVGIGYALVEASRPADLVVDIPEAEAEAEEETQTQAETQREIPAPT